MQKDPQYYRDKELLAIHRERRSIWRRKPQYVVIDPPIPRGWIRHWRLTARAKNRHDAQVLQIILREIDTPFYHWRRSFKFGKRRHRRMIDNTQSLRGIRERRWNQLGWPDHWKNYFRQILVNKGRPDQTYSYKFRREELFELFTERHYVRRLRVLDPEAESREAELENYLIHHGGSHRLTKLLDNGYRPGPDERQQILARLASRRLRKAIEGDLESEMSRCFHLFISASDRPNKSITLM